MAESISTGVNTASVIVYRYSEAISVQQRVVAVEGAQKASAAGDASCFMP